MLSPEYRLEGSPGPASVRIIKLLRNYRANRKVNVHLSRSLGYMHPICWGLYLWFEEIVLMLFSYRVNLTWEPILDFVELKASR